MHPVITFNKTYEERFQEYTDVLRTTDSVTVCAGEVQKKWCSYLQFNVDPSGWLSVWKIPRFTCELLEVEFPAIVFVHVENVDFASLKASVKTLTVEDSISLSNKHFTVSLTELWPTKQQNISVELNLDATANALDMLRIFYIYLFMPWDLEDSVSDWFTEHLETRLTLFYDMRSEHFPKHKTIYIRELLTEARHLHIHQKQLHEDSDESLLSIKVRMAHIKTEIEILENPLLRNAVLRKEQHLMTSKKEEPCSISLVLPAENKLSDYISFLNDVKKHVILNIVQYKSCLSIALADARTYETIILCKSKHTFKNLCSLQEGGNFKGLYAKEDTIITSTKEDIMIYAIGNLCFENLTIDVSATQLGILVRQGVVTLNNCRLICPLESQSQDGVIVASGGTLNVINCDIRGFNHAIVVNNGGTLYVKDSTIADVNVGLTLYDDRFVTIKSTRFQKCEDYGIVLGTDTALKEEESDGFDILQMSSITLENVTGEENGIDCSITKLKKIDLVQDLLNTQNDSSSENELDTTVQNLYN